MTPPEVLRDGRTTPGDAPPAVSFHVSTLQKRGDFLRAAKARKQPTASMLVQGRKRAPGEADGVRVGFTCSKKVGNAVLRNRAKRRLRAAARQVLPDTGQDGWDYVLIGRAEATIARPFDALVDDLRYALRKIHGSRP